MGQQMVNGDLLDARAVWLFAVFCPQDASFSKDSVIASEVALSIRLKIAAEVIGLLTLAIRNRLEVVNCSRES